MTINLAARLDRTVLYQIYPQSYADANGDGVGDLAGIRERLDYLAWLGVDAIWLSPCFASPFFDAGYDVADYLRIAPRYGTNEDLAELCAAAEERGIAVLLDLVAGHTSDEHPWFVAEAARRSLPGDAAPGPAAVRGLPGDAAPGPAAVRGLPGDAAPDLPSAPPSSALPPGPPRSGAASPSGSSAFGVDPGPSAVSSPSAMPVERYIWSDTPHEGFVAGPDGGYYLPNFFECQPALNFGYARMDPAEPWRQPVDAPGPAANRAALREIMAFWFDLGVSGFRVDMAASLVKDDAGLVETGRLWTDMREWIETTYPGRILVAEWGDPRVSVPAGFHVDFLLQFGGEDNGLPLRSLWNNFAGTVDEVWQPHETWADAEARGDAAVFVERWREAAGAIEAAGRGGPGQAGAGSAEAGHRGVVGLPTANHDFTRLVAGTRDADQARAAFALVMTWPAMPCVYYGDEIGMRYVPGTPTKEGSRLGPRYDRAGSRTPMQWGPLPAGPYGPGAPAESRYLPQDPDPDRPTVADQIEDPDSLLAFVRELIALRHSDPRLAADASVEVLATTYPFVYLRGGTLLVALNPGRRPVTFEHVGLGAGSALIARGLTVGADAGPDADDFARLDGHGYAVIDLS